MMAYKKPQSSINVTLIKSIYMKDYLILFREPDGRIDVHAEEDIARHQANWKDWLTSMTENGNLKEGKALTLNGNVIRHTGSTPQISKGLYKVNGQEIVGGFLWIKAKDLNNATELILSCPVFEFNGFAEVREFM
jgi:hypothetical protein